VTLICSRREFARLTLAGLSPLGLMAGPSSAGLQVLQGAPNSVFSGVPIGAIAPYSFGPEATTAEAILEALVKVGLSQAEIGNAPVEAFAGAPAPAAPGGRGQATPAVRAGAAPAGAPAPAGSGNAAGTPAPVQGAAARANRPRPTPEQQAAQQADAEALGKWRASAPFEKVAALRKMYNDAGVTIAAYRLTLTRAMADAEYDYTFRAAKTLGASAVTMELPSDPALSKRIGEFATKHQLMVAYHLHTTATMTAWDEALSQSPYNGIQLDIGHYVAGTSESPIPFLRKHHARIGSLHLKDRKKGTNTGVNMPWGEGDTPIIEVLKLMKSEGWRFPAFIELEYPVPAGSTRVAEVARCLAYAKAALV
jgi:sugar phosphate isomerase/epimerase